MNNHRYGRLSFVVGVLTFAVIGSALFSLAQQGLPASIPAQPQVPAFLKVAHPACPDCYTYACPQCYTIFEEVPGTGVIMAREIPNPAPLEPDTNRLEFDVETGLPIWYIGHQPYVGPTDEEPFSDALPIPKIVLKRIQARYQKAIFNISGINAFGIGANGFVVHLDPTQSANEPLIPKELEGVSVEVQLEGPAIALSHGSVSYRPVPTGSSIGANRSDVGGVRGTIGPHFVLNNPLTIRTLTAGHVVKPMNASPTIGQSVSQLGPGFSSSTFWGVLANAFQQTPCVHFNCTGDPANFSSVNPDIAVIAHISLSHTDPYPHTSPAGSLEPIRRMYYAATQSVNGPSGIIETVRQGKECKWWGVMSDAPKGSVVATNMVMYYQDLNLQQFLFSALDQCNLERAAIGGDSGALVAGNGVSSRNVFGVGVAGDLNNLAPVFYFAASDVQFTLQNAGVPFDHYWGTASGRSDLWNPAATQCDGSC